MAERPSLDFDGDAPADDPTPSVDLARLAAAGTARPPANPAAAKKAATEAGFVSRGDRRRRRARRPLSPYSRTYTVRTREELPDLMRDLAIDLGLTDGQAFDEAIKALVENKGNEEHRARLEAILTKRPPSAP